jgi:hypothetical protein
MARTIAPRIGAVRPRGYRKPSTLVLDPFHPLSRGLISCWPLGDSPAGINSDISQFGRHMSVAGTPAAAPVGSHHGGLAFSTNSGAASVSTPYSFPGYPVTLSVWANYPTTPGAGVTGYLLNLSQTTGSQQGLNIQVAGSPGSAIYIQGYDGSNERKMHTVASLPSAAVWHHYVAVFLNSTTYLLYIDGVLQSMSTDVNNNPSPTAMNLAAAGLYTYSGGSLFAFSGYLEGARIYNRALSQAEVSWLYAEPYAGIFDPKAYFSPGALHATITGSGTLGFSGLSFSASGSTVHVKGAGTLAFQGFSFVGSGNVAHIKGSGTLAFSGISITGVGFNAGVPGAGLRQFWTC